MQHAVELLQHGVRSCNLLLWVLRGAEVRRRHACETVHVP